MNKRQLIPNAPKEHEQSFIYVQQPGAYTLVLIALALNEWRSYGRLKFVGVVKEINSNTFPSLCPHLLKQSAMQSRPSRRLLICHTPALHNMSWSFTDVEKPCKTTPTLFQD